jgi:hypothetical protein
MPTEEKPSEQLEIPVTEESPTIVTDSQPTVEDLVSPPATLPEDVLENIQPPEVQDTTQPETAPENAAPENAAPENNVSNETTPVVETTETTPPVDSGITQ